MLGLMHGSWRPHQYEAIQNLENIFSEKRIAILEAPTGTGKTAIATAVARNGKFSQTTVVVQNLGLLEQYRDYGFAILKGKQAYECIDPKRITEWQLKTGKVPTATDCPYPEMYQCPYGKRCPYMVARDRALSSPLMACTYKYAALSEKVQARKGLFVMDEIHNAVSELLDIGSFAMTDTKRREHNLPDFPLKDFRNGEGGIVGEVELVEILTWIFESRKRLGILNLFDEISPVGTEKKKLLEQFDSLIELLSVCAGEVFYKCSKPMYALRYGRPREYEIEFKTISPSYLYHKMTGDKDNILMMSATIGSPSALIAGELKIKKEDYSYIKFPHPVPVDRRPIYDIAEFAMSHSSLVKRPYLYDEQARIIAKWVKEYTHPSWRGIVLTTSYKKIEKLREGLVKYLGKDALFVSTATSLQERIDEFVSDNTEGVIHVDTIQGWGTGVDLRGDIARYCVVAGVPFKNPTDTFETIRMKTPTGKAYATAYAFNAVVQATGRVSRGEKLNGRYMINKSALADKMATSPYAMKHYSDWYKDAMIKEQS